MTSGPRSDDPIDPPHGLEFFHTPPGLVDPPLLRVEGDEFSHLSHVMRRQEGDRIGVVDGAGMAYVAIIESMQKRSAVCRIHSAHPRLHESPRQLVAAVGLLKNPSRTDTLVEKLTELGVEAIVPMLTARTIPRHSRPERWEKIALAAMKQSGRCVLPLIHPLTAFADVLEGGGPIPVRLILHEALPEPRLEECVPSGWQRAIMCVGPEGGFTDEEILFAKTKGFVPAGLGPRRLRSETAAIAAAARLLA